MYVNTVNGYFIYVHCTLYSILYTVHCTLYTVQYTATLYSYILYSTLCKYGKWLFHIQYIYCYASLYY